MAHITYPIRYMNGKHHLGVELSRMDDLIDLTLRTLAQNGRALEINTSGIRQSPKEALPSVQILKMFKEAGGRYLTVGSDAHLAKDVGADFDTARQMALVAGFRHIALYEQRKPILVSVED